LDRNNRRGEDAPQSVDGAEGFVMVAKYVFVHDRRVLGQTPAFNIAHFDVDETTPLQYFVERVLQEVRPYNGDAFLSVHAHGFGMEPYGGGYGVALCREGLTLETIGLLSPLRGHVRGGIFFFSCGVAHVAPDLRWSNGAVSRGNGNLLCSRIAQTTAAPVYACEETQYSTVLLNGTFAEFPLRGIVWAYDPTGRRCNLEKAKLQAERY
jgi:hypothetical protein